MSPFEQIGAVAMCALSLAVVIGQLTRKRVGLQFAFLPYLIAAHVIAAWLAKLSTGIPVEAVLLLDAAISVAIVLCVYKVLHAVSPSTRNLNLAAMIFVSVVVAAFFIRHVLGIGSQTQWHAHNPVAPLIAAILASYVWVRERSNPRVTLLAGASFTLCFLSLTFLISDLASVELASSSFNQAFSSVVEAVAPIAVIANLLCLIGEQTSAEFKSLDSERDSMRHLLEAAPVGLCALDLDGRFTFANPAAATILNAEPESLIQTAVDEHLKPWRGGDSERSVSTQLLAPGLRNKGCAGNAGSVPEVNSVLEWMTAPVVQEGSPQGAVVVLRDVTNTEADQHYRDQRSILLELIARNRSIAEITIKIAAMVEDRLPQVHCSILSFGSEFFSVEAAPSIPEEYCCAIGQIRCTRSFNNMARFDVTERQWQSAIREVALKFGYEGTFVYPIISSVNEMIGLVLLNRFDSQFSTGERQIITEAAQLSALAFEHRRSFERLLHHGHHDALTGLPNRLLLADRLKQALARAERTHTQIAMMCIDLDRFKYINDTLGHDIGDQFLQQISVRLQTRVRASDTLARTGGDEFTVILSDVKNVLDAIRVGESLVSSINESFEIEGHTLMGSCTIGIAFYPKDGRDPETLHRNADRAMYRGKSRGKNCVQCYSEVDSGDELDRVEIDTQLRTAIANGNFSIHYQPQFTCDRRLAGFEALLRFKHPKLGMIPPSRFIPLAEESGLVLPIGEWVLDEVCRQISEWEEKGLSAVPIAVNVSPLQFAQANFAHMVKQVLQKHNIPPEMIELEVTEGVVMNSISDSKRQVDAIAAIGVRLSVDDFGTGYSSLSYLHQLPIQMLKIDRSFVAKMLDVDGTRPIVEAIISLAHRLGLKTIAEGVEEQEQLDALTAAGCDLIQGFFFSRPLPGIEASRLLWQEGMNSRVIAHRSRKGPGTRRNPNQQIQ